MEIDREEIIKWKKEGWKFRIKTVKGTKYISRRRGNEEKGLGKYNDKLWNLIQKTIKEPSGYVKFREAEELIEKNIQLVKSVHMSMSCEHIVDGFCHFWKYDEKPGFFNIVYLRFGEGYSKQIVHKDGPYYVFKAEKFFCNNCPAYRAENLRFGLLYTRRFT